MRFLTAGAFTLIAMAGPAAALDLGGTMQDWAVASPADKDDFLRKMDTANGRSTARDSLRSCLDDTAKAAGHSNLPISDVAKACSEQAAKENI